MPPVSSLSTAKLLVVDDEPEMVTLVRELLESRGYRVLGLSDPREVTAHFDEYAPDVCVFDFHMPHKTGADLLDLVKQKDPTVEVIFLTAQDEASLAVDLMKRGAMDFLLKPVDLNQLLLAIGRALEHRRLIVENERYRLQLELLVMEKTHALNEALLHDIGKLRIPESILWKPARLTELEWQTMRRHAEYGYEFLNNLEFLKGAADIVFAHHEKYDGTGYPRGLQGEEIPFGARVFMIVDTVDAMMYKRPYNKPVSFTDAAAEVRRCAGTQFDPSLIEPTLDYLGGHIPEKLI
jgi:response regulator RpfG family c-di-GMP phosphodiesterase